MKTFKDARGKEWAVSITIGTVHAVQEQMGVNLLDLTSGEESVMTRLGTDILFFADVLDVLMKDQYAAAEGVKAGSTRNIFDGPTLQLAMNAFYEDLINFFLSLNRTYQVEALRKQLASIETATKVATKRLIEIDIEEIARKSVDEQMKKIESNLLNEPQPEND